jgi:hypothetical protein
MSEGTFDVFLSHSSKDEKQANALVERIENAGYTCWVAPRNVPIGNDYSLVISEVIPKCRCMVLLVSEASIASPDVRAEVRTAFGLSIPIFPMKLDESDPGKLMYYLGNSQWYDAIARSVDDIAEAVLAGLEGRIGPQHSHGPLFTFTYTVKKLLKKFSGIAVTVVLTHLILGGTTYYFSFQAMQPVDTSELEKVLEPKPVVPPHINASQLDVKLKDRGLPPLQKIQKADLSLRFKNTFSNEIHTLVTSEDGKIYTLESEFVMDLAVRYSISGQDFTSLMEDGDKLAEIKQQALESGKLFVKLQDRKTKANMQYEFIFDRNELAQSESIAYWQATKKSRLSYLFCPPEQVRFIPDADKLAPAAKQWNWGRGKPSGWYTQKLSKQEQINTSLALPRLIPVGFEPYSVSLTLTDDTTIGPVSCKHPWAKAFRNYALLTLKLEDSAGSSAPKQIDIAIQTQAKKWTAFVPIIEDSEFVSYRLGDLIGENSEIRYQDKVMQIKGDLSADNTLYLEYYLKNSSLVSYVGKIDFTKLGFETLKASYFSPLKIQCITTKDQSQSQCGVFIDNIRDSYLDYASGKNFISKVQFGCNKNDMSLSDDFSRSTGKYLLFFAPKKCRRVFATYVFSDQSVSAIVSTPVLKALTFGTMQRQ